MMLRGTSGDCGPRAGPGQQEVPGAKSPHGGTRLRPFLMSTKLTSLISELLLQNPHQSMRIHTPPTTSQGVTMPQTSHYLLLLSQTS